MFDIHKIRPVHGWREFLGEIGIIVLGVLIALGFEQAVEAVHWHVKVNDATEALRSALAEVAFNTAEQQVSEPCIDRQLADLQVRVITARAIQPVPAFNNNGVPSVVRRPTREWSGDTWRLLTNEGTATHLPTETRDYMQHIYEQVEQLKEDNALADTAEWRLAALAYPQPDVGAERSRAIAEIAELRGRMALMTLIAGQVLGDIDQSGMMPPSADLRRATQANSGTVAFCRQHRLPIGSVHPIHA